jgi:hypothetical protein
MRKMNLQRRLRGGAVVIYWFMKTRIEAKETAVKFSERAFGTEKKWCIFIKRNAGAGLLCAEAPFAKSLI